MYVNFVVATNLNLLSQWRGEHGVCHRYIGRPLTLTGLPGSSAIRRKREPFQSLCTADQGRKAEASQCQCAQRLSPTMAAGCLPGTGTGGGGHGTQTDGGIEAGHGGKMTREPGRRLSPDYKSTVSRDSEWPCRFLLSPQDSEAGWAALTGKDLTKYPGGSC